MCGLDIVTFGCRVNAYESEAVRARAGDAGALDAAVAIRKLFDGKPLVSGVKALLAHIHGDPALARVKPPLAAFSAADRATVFAGHDAVRAKRVA